MRTPSNNTPRSPATDTIVSITVHVTNVCGTLIFKYSFASQKPPSLTCDAINDPAPIETTSSSLFTAGDDAMSGAMMLAAVTTETVAEPTESLSSDAITQPSTRGDS